MLIILLPALPVDIGNDPCRMIQSPRSNGLRFAVT